MECPPNSADEVPIEIPRALAAAKRAVDIVGAAALIVLAAPLMAVCAILVRLTSPGPAVFRQVRLGRDGRAFTILKLRTMHDGADDRDHREQIAQELAGAGGMAGDVAFKDADDRRVTGVGRFLRRFSLDELPQLVNVLVGDMSLVGPRPVPIWEAESYPPSGQARLAVRPGITGLWQVSGRSTCSTIEMLELDRIYVETLSLRRDVSILLRTIPQALKGAGAA